MTVVESQFAYPEPCARFEASVRRLYVARAIDLAAWSAPRADVEASMAEMVGLG
jgi:hypothetical protein